MLGWYHRWESDLSAEQLIEALATRLPHMRDAKSGLAYEDCPNGKLRFTDVDSGFLPPPIILTCRIVSRVDAGCIVYAGSSVVSYLFTITLFLMGFAVFRGKQMFVKFPPFILVLALFALLLLGTIMVHRKKVMDILDAVTGSSRVRCHTRPERKKKASRDYEP